MSKKPMKLAVIVLTLVMICSSCFTAIAKETTTGNNAGEEKAFVNINVKGDIVILDGVFMNEEARKTFDAVNALRAEKGVAPLVWANDFDLLGKLRAAEIQEVYSHSRPNGETRRIIKDGKIIVTGENIAMGYMSAEEVMAGWTKSPGHYANMTDVDYQSYYCACFVTYDETFGYPWYTWVQLFSFDKLDSDEKESIVTVPGNNTITIQSTEKSEDSKDKETDTGETGNTAVVTETPVPETIVIEEEKWTPVPETIIIEEEKWTPVPETIITEEEKWTPVPETIITEEKTPETAVEYIIIQ